MKLSIRPTHDELVQRAVRWLKRHHKCSIVYAEIVTGRPETPDAIGWRMGFSRLVEVKVSRSDFFRDRRKTHASRPDRGMGGQRWYLVPVGLVTADEVPEWCGLAYAHARRIEIVKEAPERERWDARGEMQVLMSALRRMELGSQFDAKTGRWESLAAREEREAAAVSRGSSRGSAPPDAAPVSQVPGIIERANGLEPSTFSLGSKLPGFSEAENAENAGDLMGDGVGQGDGK